MTVKALITRINLFVCINMAGTLDLLTYWYLAKAFTLYIFLNGVSSIVLFISGVYLLRFIYLRLV